ncbi:trafficking protein particle complex subunit 11 isoform X2 [Uranotaenia lowii]|uniref:trafficking protein particle complex subunit 11 isoform X2 n=1 Tax=Uranotaenia lowii TaxID=190385 RepID=UPI002478381D|nr:trafficking protein particle complex subunit 11 isoform X2 [Uranotaenia lowii]
MALDASVLPSELVTIAQPLVGLSGLDVQRNTIHKTIWDAFNNGKKPESESIQYKLLPQSYEFPVSKPKHQSYEWYHPKGILKRNWMLKHLHVLPAVVVLFQDLEWNDPQWSEKQLQCASIIQTLKNSLQGRNTRLAVVLLQKGAPPGQGEDLLASERAAHLTSTCDINAKMLFVLPHNDHLMSHILRLQSAFLELAQSYYTQMMKQIRLHRDQLTDSHQILKIRHQFKLGFISELKLDQSNALRHYRQTYGNLDEIRIVDTNCLEIKTIAGFVNYKICRLFFKLNAPKDSISHFKNHINKYRSRTGFKELLFEHMAWLSVQYSAFGELFCDAVKNGLAPLQTQHPGIYFHKAAEYVGRRKEAFLQCSALGAPGDGSAAAVAVIGHTAGQQLSSANANSALYSDFFGIRGTKTGEPVSEQQIICIVQELEKSFNHSAAIITLLGQAMAQYKVYKCLRFRKKLAVDMAEEYLKSGDYSKALTLYSLMLSDYRVDKWFTIFTEVLLKTLRSAYLSATVPDFVACSIEALSPSIAMEKSDRIMILENLWKVFHSVSPVSSSQIAPELTSSWQTALGAFSSPIKLDLDRLNDLLECKLTFDQRQIKNDEKLHLQLYVRSIVEVPLKLRNFSVLLTDLKSSAVRIPAVEYCEYLPTEPPEAVSMKPIEEFILEPQKCYRIRFVGERYQFMENVDVHIFRLEVQMGSDRIYAILSQREKLNRQPVFKTYNPHQDCMERIAIISSCYIIPTFHIGSQTKQNNQPMLTNEFYRITTKILNHSDLCLQNVGVSINVPQNLKSSVFLTTDLNQPMQKINSSVQIDVGELQMQSSTSISYYATSLIEGNIELHQRLFYQTENLHQNKSSVGSGPSTINDSPSTPNSEKEELAKLLQSTNNQQQVLKFNNENHNVKVEYLSDGLVRKTKEDTILLPCVEEIKLTGRFYTLNRLPMGSMAYRNEDFILRVNMEVRAPDGIDILQTQLFCDHNIIEKPYKGQLPIVGTKLRKLTRFEDLHLLNPVNCTREWVSQSNYLKSDVRLTFNRSRTPTDYSTTTSNRSQNEDQFNRNLLSKLPANATIIGSVMTSSTGSSDDFKVKPLPITTDAQQQRDESASKTPMQVKTIFNQALDCVQLTTNDRSGFINASVVPTLSSSESKPIFGVYSVRWCRSNSPTVVNESKFVILGIDVIEPPLNIYCYLEEKMYVRIPMTLRITIRNPTRKIMHLQALLNSSDSFMFSGHRQLNVSVFAFSSYDLLYNLYPLKAGWQPLPELQLDYINHSNSSTSSINASQAPGMGPGAGGPQAPGGGTVSVPVVTIDVGNSSTGNSNTHPQQSEVDSAGGSSYESQRKAELAALVKRWMPKMVFIHPPNRS